jgi:hypothetical protein
MAADNHKGRSLSEACHDYLGRQDLLDLGLDRKTVVRLLSRSPLTGHRGRRVVEAEWLQELSEIMRLEKHQRASSPPGPLAPFPSNS